MTRRLIISGLSSTSFFTLTREVIEEDYGDYIVKVVPFIPKLGETWIEQIIDLEKEDIEAIYILGSLNCMLNRYDLSYLVHRYGKVVLVPGNGCMGKAQKMSMYYREKVSIINPSGKYRDRLSRRKLFRLWQIMSYLYVEKPEELERLSKDITIPELDVNSMAENIFREYYREVNVILQILKHRLLFEKQSDNIEVRDAKHLMEKHLQLLPVLTRLISLDNDKYIIAKYTRENNPYTYMVLSLPKNHDSRIGANIIKTVLLSVLNRPARMAVKASISGANMFELMVEKKYDGYIVNKLVKLLRNIGRISLRLMESVNRTQPLVAVY